MNDGIDKLLDGMQDKSHVRKHARATPESHESGSARDDGFLYLVACALDNLIAHLLAHNALPQGYVIVHDGLRGVLLRKADDDTVLYRHSERELAVIEPRSWIPSFVLTARNYGFTENAVVGEYLEARSFGLRTRR